MRLRAGATALAAALALAACGSSSNGAKTTTQAAQGGTSAPRATTTTQTTTSPQTTTTTSTTTTTVSGPPPCTAADLAVSFLGQQGATGHGELGFSVRNKGSGSCHTFGYPGVLFLDKSGRALPTDSMRTTHDFFGRAPEVRLLLAPGGSASFRLGVTHGVTSTAQCNTAYGLQVIAPDDTATMRATIPGGAYECRTATVSPLRPGNSAYQ
jgi:Protein of unknown function (DUF4232)